MQSLVVFLALAAVAHGSLLPWAQPAQPAHYPAVVLDPHGRPLDTAEVIGARALHLQAKALENCGYLGQAAFVPNSYSVVAPAVVAAPAAVSHQSRVDVRSSPAIVATQSYASPLLATTPVWGANSAYASPLLAHSGHVLKKRSLGQWGPITYSTPIIAPSAVSHQSRVDVVSSPAIVSETVAAPVISHAVAAPVVAHAIAPSAVSHQSRVDVVSSPTVVSESISAPLFSQAVATPIVTHASPVWGARSAYASPLLTHSGLVSHGHVLKKRSLGHWGAVTYTTPIIAPSAVSHQSRVDVVSSPAIVSETVAAPVISHTVASPLVVQAIAPSAVSQQSRVDVRSSPTVITENVVAAPLLHSAPITTSLYGHGLIGW